MTRRRLLLQPLFLCIFTLTLSLFPPCTPLQTISDAHTKGVNSLSSSIDKTGRTILATCSSDLSCKLFSHSLPLTFPSSSLELSSVLKSSPLSFSTALTRFSSSTSTISLSRDGSVALAAGDVASLRIVSVSSPSSSPTLLHPPSASTSVSTPTPASAGILSVAVESSGHYYSSISAAGGVTVYDRGNSNLPISLSQRALPSSLSALSQVVRLAWTPSGSYLAIPGERSVTVCEKGGWTPSVDDASFSLPVTSPAALVCWSPDQAHLAATLIDGRVVVWSFDSKAVVDSKRFASDTFDADARSLCWAPDADVLFILRSDGRIVKIVLDLDDSMASKKALTASQTTSSSKRGPTSESPASSSHSSTTMTPKRRRFLVDDDDDDDEDNGHNHKRNEDQEKLSNVIAANEADNKFIVDSEEEEEEKSRDFPDFADDDSDTDTTSSRDKHIHNSNQMSTKTSSTTPVTMFDEGTIDSLVTDPESMSTLFSGLASHALSLRQTSFQPSAFPTDLSQRLPISLLAAHPCGLVLSIAPPTTTSASSSTSVLRRVTVAFTNPSRLCPPLLAPSSAQGSYSFAAINEDAVLLATAGSIPSSTGRMRSRDIIPALVRLVPFAPWHQDVGFSLELPPGDCPVALTLCSSAAAILTSARLLRVYSFCGLETMTVSLASDVITAASWGDIVAVVTHTNAGNVLTASQGEASPTPICMLFDTEKRIKVAEFPVALSVGGELRWLGYSNQGVLFTLDSKNVLRMFSQSMGGAWVPVLTSSERLWPLHVEQNTLVAVPLSRGQRLPSIKESRLFTSKYPLGILATSSVSSMGSIEASDEFAAVTLRRLAMREKAIIDEAAPAPKEIMTADAHLVALILKTCGTNQPLSLELAGMIETPQVLEKAIDRVNQKLKYPELVQRMQLMLEFLKAQKETQKETQKDKARSGSGSGSGGSSTVGLSGSSSGFNTSAASSKSNIYTPLKNSRVGAPQFD